MVGEASELASKNGKLAKWLAQEVIYASRYTPLRSKEISKKEHHLRSLGTI